MSFTKDAVTIRGGCICKAVRYEVAVPPFAERPPTPYKTPGADVEDLRIPCVLLCLCNTCREGTASILPTGLVVDMKTVKISPVPRSDSRDEPFALSDDKRPWTAASDVFDSPNGAPNTNLSFYKSSKYCARWFCNRCGVPLAFAVDPGVVPAEWGWPRMLDLWLGTVDREYLEKDYMKPERMVWSHYSVPWIRQFAHAGSGAVPEHPLNRIDKLLGDDIKEQLAEIAAMKSKFVDEG